MKLLYEDVLKNGLKFAPDMQEVDMTVESNSIIRTVQFANVINIHNVYDYMVNENEITSKWNPKLFPILAPPFEYMWLEYNWGANPIKIEVVTDNKDKPDKRVLDLVDLTDGRIAILVEGLNTKEARLRPEYIKKATSLISNFDDEATWLLATWIVFEQPDGNALVTGLGSVYYVQKDGSINPDIRKSASLVLPDYFQDLEVGSKNYFGLSSLIYTITLPALMAISFMHCKNVEQIEYDPSKPVKRSVRRRNPNIKFTTLKVNPMGSKKSEGSGFITGTQMPMHIARGHFKTYTEDAPLMGKHVGTYWWGAQVRGSKSKGEVYKDYEIETPEDIS